MSAPIRIWAWEDDFDGFEKRWWATQHVRGTTEYVRADLPPTLEAALALPEVAALVEAAQQMRERFEIATRGRTWSMSDMVAVKQLDAALAALEVK